MVSPDAHLPRAEEKNWTCPYVQSGKRAASSRESYALATEVRDVST